MSAHTPGPWRVHVEQDSGIGRTSSVYICADGEWPASQVARANTMDGLDEREANARLIASAPCLLEALKALRVQALQSPDLLRTEWGQEALNLAHAAISKASPSLDGGQGQ